MRDSVDESIKKRFTEQKLFSYFHSAFEKF